MFEKAKRPVFFGVPACVVGSNVNQVIERKKRQVQASEADKGVLEVRWIPGSEIVLELELDPLLRAVLLVDTIVNHLLRVVPLREPSPGGGRIGVKSGMAPLLSPV